MASMVQTTVSAFRDSVHSLSEHFERKFTEIEQKLNRLAADRVDSVNQMQIEACHCLIKCVETAQT